MLHRRLWSALIGAFMASAAATACGGDEVEIVQPGPGTGEQGQSCSSNADCRSDLVCFRNVCVADGDELPDQLGEVGETCQSRSDCREGLQCIANLCSDKPPPKDALSKRGESCETRSDCESGLTCVNRVCAVEEFALEPTGKVCVSLQCKEAADCLPYAKDTCEYYSEDCKADPPTGTSAQSCDFERLYCTASNWECTKAGACAFTGSCTYEYSPSYACPSNVSYLVCDTKEDKCVECIDALDCAIGQACVKNKCVKTCQKREDCTFFEDCQKGECVQVGCQSDRECVAYTRNALSTCDTKTKKCSEPCEKDAECDSTFNYRFRACIKGTCQDVGCESDEECRIRGGSPTTKWSCRKPD
jgi:hypothetical protein